MAEPSNRQPAGIQLATATKDLSLLSLIPKWAGTGRSCAVHEFLEAVESTARVGNWSEADKVSIASLKLTDDARLFFNTSPVLQTSDLTWATSSKALRDRFQDTRSKQFHHLQLHTAKQK
jgi:hypothetical protein